MTPIDVLIEGDITFRGRVVARRYVAGVFMVEGIPKLGDTIHLEKHLGGAVSEWAGDYYVTRTQTHIGNGFELPTHTVFVVPVEERP